MTRPRVGPQPFPTVGINDRGAPAIGVCEPPSSEMQVRRRTASHITGKANLLAAVDTLPLPDVDDRQMNIPRSELAAGMANLYDRIADSLAPKLGAAVGGL